MQSHLIYRPDSFTFVSSARNNNDFGAANMRDENEHKISKKKKKKFYDKRHA